MRVCGCVHPAACSRKSWQGATDGAGEGGLIRLWGWSEYWLPGSSTLVVKGLTAMQHTVVSESKSDPALNATSPVNLTCGCTCDVYWATRRDEPSSKAAGAAGDTLPGGAKVAKQEGMKHSAAYPIQVRISVYVRHVVCTGFLHCLPLLC